MRGEREFPLPEYETKRRDYSIWSFLRGVPYSIQAKGDHLPILPGPWVGVGVESSECLYIFTAAGLTH